MTRRYELVIVGTGTAAMVAAMGVRTAGWSVAIIDFRPFGGTCALRGCDPKKMLIAGAETVDSVARMRGRGVTGDVRIDWPELIAFKRTFTDPIPQKREHSYAEKGIDTFHGHARFTDRNTMVVDGRALEGRHFLIAAGAEPIKLGIPGAEHLVTHEEFLALESLPARIVLVGGGYIAAEFAHIAARAGAVGLSEAQARERGLRFRMQSQKASDWYTARRVAEPTYGFKVLVEEPSERILGAHLVGPHADEVINVFALAIRHGLTAEDLKTTMFAYPTGASDIGYML